MKQLKNNLMFSSIIVKLIRRKVQSYKQLENGSKKVNQARKIGFGGTRAAMVRVWETMTKAEK